MRIVIFGSTGRTGKHLIEQALARGYRINTGDVAEFMLRQVSSDEYVGQAPAIAY
jgi:nucleoside-diphosphate-sugar epimerase